ncbi:MAG: hypothetical protein JWP97_2083, partial [Labilithrix sp.]|nr:hypothetical protein [Labilithrix sp.]
TAKIVAVVAAAFVAGGATGAAIHAAAVPSQPARPAATAPSVSSGAAPSALAIGGESPASPRPELPSVAASALPEATMAAPVVGRPLPAAPATTTSAGSSPSAPTAATVSGSDGDLAAERALVDRARAALGRGQSKDALDALDAHAVRFPKGRLSEEREALAIDALARAGRRDEALARAARFRAAYPNSVFGAVVDAAVAPR